MPGRLSSRTLGGTVGGVTQADCIQLAASVIVLFDYVITLPQEVDVIWMREWTLATYLFMANRLFAFCFALSLIFLASPGFTSLVSCKGSSYLFFVAQLMLIATLAVFSALRVYAIGRGAVVPAVAVFLLYMVSFSADLYTYTTATFAESALHSRTEVCVIGATVHENWLIIFEFVNGGCYIVADSIVIAITWWKTHTIMKVANDNGVNAPLMTLILRDGTIYFAVLLVLYVAEVATSLATNSTLNITYIVTASMTIIVSRFLLSLRQMTKQPEETIRMTTVTATSRDLRFTSGFGTSFGGELDHGFGLNGLWKDADGPGDIALSEGVGDRPFATEIIEGEGDVVERDRRIVEVL